MSFPAPPGPGPTPDIAGFADRQAYLRSALGRDVRLYGPADILYDPTVPPSAFDDEGIPLDPLVGASAVASAGVAIADLTVLGMVRANVVFMPLSTALVRRDQVTETPVGLRSSLNKDLIIDIADKALADTASHFMVGTLTAPEGVWTPDDGTLWKVVNVESDGFAGLQRAIVYGEGTR